MAENEMIPAMTADEEAEIRRVVECDWKHRSERWACLLLLAALDATRAERDAANARANGAYTIKPLAWKDDTESGLIDWSAETVFGDLHVAKLGGRYKCFFDSGSWSLLCESIEDGKARAEAYYRSRLLAALAAVRANRDAGPGSRAFAPTTIDGENEEFVAEKVADAGTYTCGCSIQRSDNLKGFCPVHHDPIATTPPPG